MSNEKEIEAMTQRLYESIAIHPGYKGYTLDGRYAQCREAAEAYFKARAEYLASKAATTN